MRSNLCLSWTSSTHSRDTVCYTVPLLAVTCSLLTAERRIEIGRHAKDLRLNQLSCLATLCWVNTLLEDIQALLASGCVRVSACLCALHGRLIYRA